MTCSCNGHAHGSAASEEVERCILDGCDCQSGEVAAVIAEAEAVAEAATEAAE